MPLNSRAALALLPLLLAACATAPEQPEAPAESPAPAAAPAAPTPPQGDTQQFAYAMGYDIGVQLRQVAAYIRLEPLYKGLDEVWDGRSPSLSEADQTKAKAELGALARANSLAATPEAAGEDLPPRVSYGIGADIAHSLDGQHARFDEATLQSAIADGLNDKPARLDEAGRQAARGRLREQLQQERAQLAVASKAKGEEFLAANGHRIGVKTTASGLQYEVLKTGKGKHPKKEQKVEVHYTGTLLDGSVFDDSRARGTPAKFPLDRVIPGWTEGVQLMTVGSRYKFWIPSNLAYGERGAGNKIGPNQVLVFDVELLSIE